MFELSCNGLLNGDAYEKVMAIDDDDENDDVIAREKVTRLGSLEFERTHL